MALARFYFDKGDRLQAFYIVETARRSRFEEPVFDEAFLAAFVPNSPEKPEPLLEQYDKRIEALVEKDPAQAKTIALEAIAKFPASGDFKFILGALLQNEGKLDEAEAQLVKAAELSRRSAYIQTWVGRFFFKVRKDNQKALVYYLNAYFLSPHAYETEFVESRIQKINQEAATARIELLLKNGTPLMNLARDPNPAVAWEAISMAAEKWRPEYLATMVELMGHDDESVRSLASEAIKNHANQSFDEQLRTLLQDKDLRKRGMAAYIAVHRWKQASFPLMRAMLREEAQLLRYDALSALVIEGGPEGRRIVLEHRKNEHHPALLNLIDKRDVKDL